MSITCAPGSRSIMPSHIWHLHCYDPALTSHCPYAITSRSGGVACEGVGHEQDCISTLPSLQQCDAHYATNLWYALCYVVCIIVSLREGQRLRLHSLEPHTVGGCLQTSVQVVHCLQGETTGAAYTGTGAALQRGGNS